MCVLTVFLASCATDQLLINTAQVIGGVLGQPMRPRNTCRVVGVTDGDSINCLYANNRLVKVRLHQIDAPEIGQAFGRAAKKQLSGYVFNKQVTLKLAENDRYGRTLAEVFVNGINVNKAMVKSGYAWAYKKYVVDNEYIALEDAAKQARYGLWDDPNAINPALWRKGERPTNQNLAAFQSLAAPVQKVVVYEQTEPPKASRPKPKRRTPKPRKRPRRSVSNANVQGFKCGTKRFCKQMNSCREAMFYLKTCGVRRLDRDKDGVPCESICGGG